MTDTKIQVLGVGSRVDHPAFGQGVVVRVNIAAYDVCFIQHGMKLVGKEYENWEIIDAISSDETVSFSAAEKALAKILRTWNASSEIIELGEKWVGGTMILRPKDDSLKDKEIPIDTFFHKIVMTRDRLRVMEQRINSSKNLSDEEKVNLQQYVTRIYGSLTSFNVLFKQKKDHFKGGTK